MTHELRCQHCDYWLGESPEPLVYVKTVENARTDPRVESPRDLRLCKKCWRVNVFIPRRDLDSFLAQRIS